MINNEEEARSIVRCLLLGRQTLRIIKEQTDDLTPADLAGVDADIETVSKVLVRLLGSDPEAAPTQTN